MNQSVLCILSGGQDFADAIELKTAEAAMMKRKGKNCCNSFFDAALAMSGVIVTAVVFSAGVVAGSEWNTASGHHCIDACRYSGSENLGPNSIERYLA